MAETIALTDTGEPAGRQMAPPVEPGRAPGVICRKFPAAHQRGLGNDAHGAHESTLFRDVDPDRSAAEGVEAHIAGPDGAATASPAAPPGAFGGLLVLSVDHEAGVCIRR